MNPKEVEKCCKCRNWIGFLENAVCVETGRMGQEWQVGYGFITNPLQKKFYHESCFNNLNENREVKNEIIKDTNIN
jgi:hypothetical protein